RVLFRSKNLPEQPVTFSIDESTYSVEIISDNGRYKLSGENATDFPKVPAVANDFNAEISSEVLARAINNTIFATSNDELRPAMTGVYVNLDRKSTRLNSSHVKISYAVFCSAKKSHTRSCQPFT